MNITPFEMYWITRASAINTFFMTLMLVSIIVSAVAISAIHEFTASAEERARVAKKTYSILFSLLVFSVLGAIFTPRTKDLAAIIAIPAIVNSDIAKEKIPETLNGLFTLAEAWMEELKPEKEAE